MCKKKLLFINPGQFGYQSGYYYYCKYLKKDFDITFLCFDQGYDKISIDGIKIKYIKSYGNRFSRIINSLFFIVKELITVDYNIIFTVYFKFSFLISLVKYRRKTVLDIRSESVKKSIIKNYINNKLILVESFFFKNITILSNNLIGRIGLNPHKCHYLPLGSDVFSDKAHDFNSFNLLYVGVFNNRNICETIEGFAKFYDEYNNLIECTYDILGFGSEHEERIIKDKINNLNLDRIIQFHGRKNHIELKPYFEKCNIGISYVPMTKHFNYQPPTKTFEYIISGLVCIATATEGNKLLINNKNGALCLDNSNSFYDALKQLFINREIFNSEEIRKTLVIYQWENIVNNNLKPYLQSL